MELQYKLFIKGESDFENSLNKLKSLIGEENIVVFNNLIAVYYNYANLSFSRIRQFCLNSGLKEIELNNCTFYRLNELCLKRKFFITEIKAIDIDSEYLSNLSIEAMISDINLITVINESNADIKKYSFRVPSSVCDIKRNITITKEGIILMDDNNIQLSIEELLQLLNSSINKLEIIKQLEKMNNNRLYQKNSGEYEMFCYELEEEIKNSYIYKEINLQQCEELLKKMNIH